MKILVIEDQADIRATLTDMLEINGHEVLAAEDGVVGVKLAAQQPDFIFCDMMMPNLDGPGVLAAVKQMPLIRDVPFVFLTARATRDEQREGMTLGADDYITKPFTESDLLNAIAARTHRHRNLKEQIQHLAAQYHREIHAQWSHELLTPLNAVFGYLDMIMESDIEHINPGELKEMLVEIRRGAERQERLARKLIRYFELEQLLQTTQPAKSGHCQAAAAASNGATQAAQKHSRESELSVALAPGEVTVPDAFLLYAVSEVVDNAFIYSPAGSPVSVTGQSLAGRYRIVIADLGPGLTAEQRAGVGAFTQFDRRKREQQGLGLGLAIARATAKLAGGDLSLEAGEGGRGLQVIFTLPLAGG